MVPPPRRTVQLEAKVVGARGLVSSKGEGEPCTTTASLTLLSFDPVESEPVSESTEPTYELSKITLVKADDASIAELLSTPLAVSILEGTPKRPRPRDHARPQHVTLAVCARIHLVDPGLTRTRARIGVRRRWREARLRHALPRAPHTLRRHRRDVDPAHGRRRLTYHW